LILRCGLGFKVWKKCQIKQKKEFWRKFEKIHDLTHAFFKFLEEDAKSPLKNLST
jgi:hypothetical protein